MTRIRVRSSDGDDREIFPVDEASSTLRGQTLADDTLTLDGTVPRLRAAHPATALDGAEPGQSEHDTPTPLLPLCPTPTAGDVRATLTVMSGPEAGLVVSLDRDALVIGRDAAADLWVDDPGLSRHHARVARAPDGGYFVEDLGSTNGTFVEGRKVSIGVLAHGDHLQLGTGFVLRFGMTRAADESLQRHLFESSITDELTRVFNRRYLTDRLVADMAQARRTNGELSIVLADIDHFKDVNDRHGHLAGDRALAAIARTLVRCLSGHMIVARYGGEEFIVVAPGQGRAQAMRLAELLRRAVEATLVTSDAVTFTLTASFGVASLAEIEPLDGPSSLVALADERLYSAKLAGRNRVGP